MKLLASAIRDVDPVGEEPAAVVVRIAGPSFGQHAGEPGGGGHRGPDVLLQVVV